MALSDLEKRLYAQRIDKTLNLIRPYLQDDGGDVEFVEITDNYDVKVRLTGSCSQCKMKIQTLKLGIEKTLKRNIPEINSVIEVQS